MVSYEMPSQIHTICSRKDCQCLTHRLLDSHPWRCRLFSHVGRWPPQPTTAMTLIPRHQREAVLTDLRRTRIELDRRSPHACVPCHALAFTSTTRPCTLTGPLFLHTPPLPSSSGPLFCSKRDQS